MKNKINLKMLTGLFALFFLTLSLAVACGQKEADNGKVLIGISKIIKHPALDALEQGIQDELNEKGYEAEFDLQNANGEIATASSIANKFKSEKVDVAVGIATPTAQALVKNITDSPVVFSAVTDPVAAGLVQSIENGSGNVTGISDMTPVKQQIQFLNRIKKIKKLGIIYSSHEDNAVALANITKEACKELGIEVVETTVTKSSEVKQAAQAIISRVDGIYISTDNTVVSALNAITEVAINKGVPVMSADPSSAESSDVIAAWGFDYYKMGRATGRMIIEILDGKDPATMPVMFMTDPSDVDLLINLDVADKLGLKIPEDIIDSAHTIVKDGKVTK